MNTTATDDDAWAPSYGVLLFEKNDEYDEDDGSNLDKEQEEFHITQGHEAEEIETMRNNIAASLIRS